MKKFVDNLYKIFLSSKLKACMMLLVAAGVMYSCSQDTITDPEPKESLEIGDEYQGGIIAYILQPGDPGYDANVTHGIIAAPSNQSEGIQWWNGSATPIGGTRTGLGTGQANTTAIVAEQGAGSYAAQICNDLVWGGYNDWYLPSKDELNKLYLNREAVGGFAIGDYWSSSQHDFSSAYFQAFPNGYYMPVHKMFTNKVRPVRSF